MGQGVTWVLTTYPVFFINNMLLSEIKILCYYSLIPQCALFITVIIFFYRDRGLVKVQYLGGLGNVFASEFHILNVSSGSHLHIC